MKRLPRATVESTATIPAVSLRILIVALGASAFAFVPSPLVWAVAALALTGAIVPRSTGVWLSAAIMALAQLLHPLQAIDARPFVVLAIVHLLHVVGALTLAVDWRGTIELRALVPSLRRLLAIQVPAQAVLAIVLVVSVGEWRLSGPAAAVVALLAACAAAGAVVVVAWPRLRGSA